MKFTKIIYLTSLFLLFNCKTKSNKKNVKETLNDTILTVEKDTLNDKKVVKYVNAETGLLFRNKPKGKVLGKFYYGEKVEIIENTGLSEEIKDGNKNIYGEWLGIKKGEEKVYSFGSFLVNEKQFKINNSKFYKPLYGHKNIKKDIKITPVSKNEYTKLNLNNGTLRKNLKIEFVSDDDNENPYAINSALHQKSLYRLGSRPFISPKGNYFVSGVSGFVFAGTFDLFEIDINHKVNTIVSFEFKNWTKAEHLSEDDRKLSPNKYDIKWINNKSFLLPIFENNNYEKVKYLKIEIL